MYCGENDDLLASEQNKMRGLSPGDLAICEWDFQGSCNEELRPLDVSEMISFVIVLSAICPYNNIQVLTPLGCISCGWIERFSSLDCLDEWIEYLADGDTE